MTQGPLPPGRRGTGRRSAFVLALAIHALLFALLFLGLEWSPVHRPALAPPAEIVKARVIDEARLREAEAAKRRKAEAERRRREAAERKKAAAEKRRREAEARKKAAAEKRRREAEARKKAAAEKRRREAEARKKAAAEKRRREAEARKKVAAEKRRREAEARKKAAAEKRRREELARQAAQERALEEQLLLEEQQREERRIEADRQRRIRSLIDHTIALIQQKVERNWIRPPESAKGLSCRVLVRLLPGGLVVGVRLKQSSGDELFDRSVINAVHKASPLPLPDEPGVFEYFRELEFVFKPEG